MREILFRGKRVDNGEWIEGFYCNEEYNLHIHEIEYIPRIQVLGKCISYGVISDCFGEYSGMPDKFGNKIFEGDIVKITMPLRGCKPIIETSEVYFDRCCFCVNWHGIRTRMDDFASHVTFEIIGNVFDSPELLKVGE